MEAWVNLTASTGKIVGRTNQSVTRGYLLGVENGKVFTEFWDSGGVYWNNKSGSVPANSWNHLAVTWQTGGSYMTYINGTKVNTNTSSNNILGNFSTMAMRIGTTPWDNPQWNVTGSIDEVRVSKTVRSDKWIATGYNNTNRPDLFTSFGSEEPYFCSGAPGPYYVQSRSQSYPSASQAQITLPYSTTAGDLLVLSLVVNQSLSVSSVIDSVNGMNRYNLVSMTNVGTWGKLYTYYVNNSLGGGPITATVTLNGAATTFNVSFLEYGGVAAVNPLDQSSSGSGSGTALDSGSRTITGAPELIYGFGAGINPCSGTAPYTNRETANGRCAVDQTVSSTGSYNVIATQSPSGAWALQMVTFRGS
jgi:hypothetical protein